VAHKSATATKPDAVLRMREKAKILDSDVEALRSVLLGEAMTDARNLEHAADRPRYWMDTDHEARPSVEDCRVQHPSR
jgi:hypothetical protein